MRIFCGGIRGGGCCSWSWGWGEYSKYPFWKMTRQNPKATYACVNLEEAYVPGEIGERSAAISADIGSVLQALGQDT